jgi:serine/threonine protein kinase/Tfp pilus assembly protein PilF
MPDTNSWPTPDGRFEQVLAEILLAEEAGQPLELSSVIQTYPELETPLREYFRNRDSFDRLAPRLAPTAEHRGAPPPEPPPDRHFGGYAVLEKVGEGGRGVVYRVSDRELHRPLAVKVLRPELRDEPDAGRRFLEEAQVMGQLQHPGIVPVHCLGQLPDGRPYFVMKLVQGQTLAELLAQRPAAADDRPRWLAIFQQVCQAVAYAHSRGVIHRDLKPSNIMVGAFGEVQVMDWGLAKVLSTEAVSPEPARGETDLLVAGAADTIRTARTGKGVSSADGLVVGTVAYMSPEQAQGQVEQLDRRADVFGLGAVLCELLTSRPPYCATSGWKLHQMASTGDLADAFARLDGCGADAELIALAKDCLAPERELRPANAAVVAERLANYLADVQERLRRAELEKAAAQARAEEARATVRAERRARRLTVGLALAVVVSLTVGGLWWQRQQAEKTRQTEALRRDAGTALAQAIRFRQGAHFKESSELLEQAQQRLGTDGPADLREEVDQALADTELARRLDAARQRALTVVGGGKMDFDGAEREYAAALKEAGLGQVGEDPGVVAARLPATLRAEVVAALDDWASIAGNEPRREWLLAVVRAADPDPERDRLRQPELWRDGTALARLLRKTRVAKLSPQLAMALARALSDTGGDPIPLLREAQGHYPQDFWLNFGLATALNLAKQWDEAIGYYRAALALRREATVHNNFGTVLRDKGRHDEAIAHYKEAIRINPKHAGAHNNLGVALCDKRRLDEAIVHYKEALRIDPNFAIAHNNLGAALHEKKQWDKAIVRYKEALRIAPNYAEAHYNFGDALRDKGELGEAIAHYKKAVKIKPNYAEAHNNLGIALCLNDQHEEAIVHFKKAVRINAKDAEAHYNLGLALYFKKRLDEAIVHYKKALEIKPDYAEAHYNLGLALHVKRRLNEAINHFQKVIDLLPQRHPQRAAAMQLRKHCEEALQKRSRETKPK